MPIDGHPIPLAITETCTPSKLPVYPKIPRTDVTSLGDSRKFSAINFARRGSPGISTVRAKSPFSAPICGVIRQTSILSASSSRQHPANSPGYSCQYSFRRRKTAALILLTRMPDSVIEAFPVEKTSESIIAGL